MADDAIFPSTQNTSQNNQFGQTNSTTPSGLGGGSQPLTPQHVAPTGSGTSFSPQSPAASSNSFGQTPVSSPRPSNPPPPPPPRMSFSFFRIPFLVKAVIGIAIFFFIVIILGAVFQTRNFFQPKVTLVYWGLWENENTMNQIFADFSRKYPYITISYQEQDPTQYTDRLLTRTKNGNGPDIFTYHNSWVPELLPILAPLSTDAITKNDFETAFYPVAQSDLESNGAIYGIPLEIDTLSMFVNNSILKAAGVNVPQTWDDFTNVATQTTVKDDTGKIKTAGAAMGAYDNIGHASDIASMLLAQNGANLTNLSSTSKNASDALNFYGSFVSNQNNVWDSSIPSSLVVFAQGNLAMYFGYSYDIFNIKAINPSLDFAIYPVPHLPDRSISVASYWVQGVSVKSQHQKEAMLLMHYLAQKDTQEKLYSIEAKTRLFGEPYARVDLADTLKNDKLVYPFVSQAKTAVSTYFASNTYDTGINAQMNGYIGNAIRSVASGSSADSAVDTLSQGVTQILQQYGVQPKSNP